MCLFEGWTSPPPPAKKTTKNGFGCPFGFSLKATKHRGTLKRSTRKHTPYSAASKMGPDSRSLCPAPSTGDALGLKKSVRRSLQQGDHLQGRQVEAGGFGGFGFLLCVNLMIRTSTLVGCRISVGLCLGIELILAHKFVVQPNSYCHIHVSRKSTSCIKFEPFKPMRRCVPRFSTTAFDCIGPPSALISLDGGVFIPSPKNWLHSAMLFWLSLGWLLNQPSKGYPSKDTGLDVPGA